MEATNLVQQVKGVNKGYGMQETGQGAEGRINLPLRHNPVQSMVTG